MRHAAQVWCPLDGSPPTFIGGTSKPHLTALGYGESEEGAREVLRKALLGGTYTSSPDHRPLWLQAYRAMGEAERFHVVSVSQKTGSESHAEAFPSLEEAIAYREKAILEQAADQAAMSDEDLQDLIDHVLDRNEDDREPRILSPYRPPVYDFVIEECVWGDRCIPCSEKGLIEGVAA